MTSFKRFSLFTFIVLIALSCNKEKDVMTTLFQVRLTDAPGNYDEVNIDIESVEVHTAENGWETLNTKKGVYNLLNLTNGIDTIIASSYLPVGKVSQIRLNLGNNNSIVVNGTQYNLSIPSANTSGLKLQVHEELKAGITYEVLLDFDAAKSIVLTGSSNYKLKPVIRTITNALSGAIKGHINPVGVTTAIYAIANGDSSATFANANGDFLIQGLAPATYSVYADPAAPYNSKTINSVAVTLAKVTDVGTIDVN